MSEGWSYYLDYKDQSFELEKEELTAGRSRACDVPVNDPSVSRRHVMLKADNGRILLKDLGSSNGTFINGTRVEAGGELHHGDSLGLGDADLKVRIAGASAFQTVRMEAHPLQPEHGDATLFLQQASADLAQEAMEIEEASSHMAPPAPSHMAPPPPTEPGLIEPPPPRPSHMAPPAPAQPDPPAEPRPAPPGPSAQPAGAQQAAPSPAEPRPTSPTGVEPLPAVAAPPAPPRQTAEEPAAPPATSPPIGVPKPAPPSAAPQPIPPPVAAPPPVQPAPPAPEPTKPAATPAPMPPTDVRGEQATGDLLPSLDGFDVTMGPEMMAAIEPKAAEETAAPAYNPYSAPGAQASPAAGFGIRLLAVLVDDLWIAGIWAALFFSGQDNLVASIAACGIGWSVILFGWAIWGTTPGKRAFNLYVTAGDGPQAGIGFPRALARMVGYVASTIPVFIGFLMIAFSKSKRGLHDIIAGTQVSRQP